MLDSKKLRENPEYLKEILERRGLPNPWMEGGNGLDLEGFLKLQKTHLETLGEIERLRTRRNQISEEFARLKREKKDTEVLSKEIESVKNRLAAGEKKFAGIEAQ